MKVIIVFTGVCSEDVPEDEKVLMKLLAVIVSLSFWPRVIFHLSRDPSVMVHVLLVVLHYKPSLFLKDLSSPHLHIQAY